MALLAEISTSESSERASGQAFDRPVDLVHLSRYTLGNRSLEREVLSLFLTQSQLYVQRLKEAREDKQWHDAAHTIKGSAKSIGAWQLARCAEKAESMDGCRDDPVRSRETRRRDKPVYPFVVGGSGKRNRLNSQACMPGGFPGQRPFVAGRHELLCWQTRRISHI